MLCCYSNNWTAGQRGGCLICPLLSFPDQYHNAQTLNKSTQGQKPSCLQPELEEMCLVTPPVSGLTALSTLPLNHIPSLKKQSKIALIHFPVRIVGCPGWPCCPAVGVTELLPTPAVRLQYPIKSPLTDRDRVWYRGACLDVTQCFLVFKPW